MHGTPSQRHREGQHSENRKSALRTPKPHWVWDVSCRGTAWSCEEPASSPLDGPLHRRPRENASGQEAQPGPGLPSHISLQVRSHSCRPCSCSQNEKNPENPAPCSQLEWPDDDRAPSFALMGWSAPSEHLPRGWSALKPTQAVVLSQPPVLQSHLSQTSYLQTEMENRKSVLSPPSSFPKVWLPAAPP